MNRLVHTDTRIGGIDLTRWSTAVGRLLVRAARRAVDRFGLSAAFVVPLAIGAVVFASGVLGFGEVYEAVQEHGDLARLDEPVLRFAVSIRTDPAEALVTGFTRVGGPVVAPILTVAAILLLVRWRRSWTPALVVAPAALGSLLMTVVGKPVFDRVRPPLASAVAPFESSPSFPSGHALNAVVIAGAVAYLLLLRRRTAAGRATTVLVAVLYALGMGLSRVYLGHHWFTDVVAAWLLGLAWLAVVVTVHRLLLTVRSRGPAFRRRSAAAA